MAAERKMLAKYLAHQRDLWTKRDQQRLPHAWRLRDPASSQPANPDKKYAVVNRIDMETILDACETTLKDPLLREVVGSHLQVVHAVLQDDYARAFALQTALISSFLRAMLDLGRWTVPILFTFNLDLRLLATKADMVAQKEGRKTECLSEAARLLNRAFNVCITDRSEIGSSHIWGTLGIINNLFKIYFRLRQLRLCHNVLRASSITGFPKLQQFPASQAVTFKYYCGLLAFYEENYPLAEDNFIYALKHCHRQNVRNRRLALNYLIPTKLLLTGQLASAEILRKYNLDFYADFLEAYRTGNVRLFNAALERHQLTLAEHGTYLITERLKLNVYRTLFKRVYLLRNKNPKLPVQDFQCALRFVGEELEIEEVECILAVLIERGWMKGYISRERQFVVLSQISPFPPFQRRVTFAATGFRCR